MRAKFRSVAFRALAWKWFRWRAPCMPERKRQPLNPSNPDRRVICRHCFPDRELAHMNWYAVYCPFCGGEALEEMTDDEFGRVQLEIQLADAMNKIPSHSPFVKRGPLVR